MTRFLSARGDARAPRKQASLGGIFHVLLKFITQNIIRDRHPKHSAPLLPSPLLSPTTPQKTLLISQHSLHTAYGAHIGAYDTVIHAVITGSSPLLAYFERSLVLTFSRSRFYALRKRVTFEITYGAAALTYACERKEGRHQGFS